MSRVPRQVLILGCVLLCGIPAATTFAAGMKEIDLPAASPESEGMQSDVLCEMSEYVQAEGHDVRAIVVLRHGTIVLEWYAGGVTRDHNHNVYSVTKSVVATLTGIAIDEGRLAGADATLSALYPDSPAIADDAIKQRMTIADLLTMRSGLPQARANQPAGPLKELFNRIHQAPDRERFILELDMAGTPGQTFLYGNAEPQLMLAILEHATSERARAFAERALFGPLGFENAQWIYPDRSGMVAGGYGLRLRAIDLAKLGQIYLQGGTWRGRRIVSADWVRQATTDQTGTGYGYFWWTGIDVGRYTSYAAKGVRGQTIQVVPELDLVFVVTANLPAEQVRPVLSKLAGLAVESVAADAALPESPEATKRLREELARALRFVPASREGLTAAELPFLPDDSTAGQRPGGSEE